jgi:hypothetical protein
MFANPKFLMLGAGKQASEQASKQASKQTRKGEILLTFII